MSVRQQANDMNGTSTGLLSGLQPSRTTVDSQYAEMCPLVCNVDRLPKEDRELRKCMEKYEKSLKDSVDSGIPSSTDKAHIPEVRFCKKVCTCGCCNLDMNQGARADLSLSARNIRATVTCPSAVRRMPYGRPRSLSSTTFNVTVGRGALAGLSVKRLTNQSRQPSLSGILSKNHPLQALTKLVPMLSMQSAPLSARRGKDECHEPTAFDLAE